MTNTASAPMGMRLKTIATLFAVSAVILTGSPAFATQISRHDARSQTIESCGAFDACSPRGITRSIRTAAIRRPIIGRTT